MENERSYVALPHEYLSEMDELDDAAFGRLIRGLLHYSMTGEIPAFDGDERFVWKRAKNREDYYQEQFRAVGESRTERARKAAQARWNTSTNDANACSSMLKHAQASSSNANECLDMLGDASDAKSKSKSKSKSNIINNNDERPADDVVVIERKRTFRLADAIKAEAGDNQPLIDSITAFCDHRKALKRPVSTQRIFDGIIKALNDLAGDDAEQKIELLDYAAMKGWLMPYPIKDRVQVQEQKRPSTNGEFVPGEQEKEAVRRMMEKRRAAQNAIENGIN